MGLKIFLLQPVLQHSYFFLHLLYSLQQVADSIDAGEVNFQFVVHAYKLFQLGQLFGMNKAGLLDGGDLYQSVFVQ